MIAETLGSRPLDDPSLADVVARLAELETRVRLAVARRRATDPEPDDPFRGLYLSDAGVERVLASSGDPRDRVGRLRVAAEPDGVAQAPEAPEAAATVLRMGRLGLVFHLDERDLDLLLIAMAPDLDARFERLYGYLNDDVSRRRATVGLSLELSGLSSIDGEARWRLSPAGPLVSGGLLLVEDAERPVLSRSLRVPDRVTSHILGIDVIEPDLRDVLGDAMPRIDLARSEALEQALRQGVWPIQVRETGMASGVATAVASIAALGAASLTIDLGRVATSERAEALVAAAVREARLQGAVLVASGIESIADRAPRLIAQVVEAACPVVVVGGQTWDPRWSSAVPVHLDAPAPSGVARRSVWEVALESEADQVTADDLLLGATDAFKLTAPQVRRATRSAHLRAFVDDRSIEPGDLQAGARAQNGAGLERLARRVEPQAGWNDLVLPPETRTQLEELAIRVRHRERVLDDWGFGARSTRGRGMTVLFSGESGTGKTLAAEVIAARLGLDLYVIDLSTVVDKYIGETEKNLDRIFAEADRINGVLLFDEADAIFGKRSEVRDARDRYANLEVAYLLQRMERFDGLAVLTTNLRANLDDAFTRRLDVIVDFPMPEAAYREALWRKHLPEGLPRADDLDLEFMARRFRLSGGHIRNVCVTAAYLSADADRPVTMADLIHATEREYRKLGRLTVEDEFGPYHALITAPTST